MMRMAEEPERRISVRPLASMIADFDEDDNHSATKETAISSTSSTEDTDPHDEHLFSTGQEDNEDCSEATDMTIKETRRSKRNEECTTETEESDEIVNNYSINPNSLSTPSPSSPAGSLRSNGGGSGCGGANSGTRRIFTPEFKQRVLEAFTNDPECIGNQRATARKFNIHRRQVQKWLQQLTGSDFQKDQQSSDEQEQKLKNDKETDSSSTRNSSPISFSETRNNLAEKIITHNNSSLVTTTTTSDNNNSDSNMPIVAGKVPSLMQPVSSSVTLPTSSPLINISKSLGNIHHHHPLFSNSNSNMLMGLASPLLSANLNLPLSLDNSRHSPRLSPHYSNCINGSPPNGNVPSAQKMLQLVDELCYLYPSEDFSLLRRAMIKNEVSFTKISSPLRRNNTTSNSGNSYHTSSSSPTPSKSSTTNDYITQQTLQMIKNQNEYLQFLHSSGYGNLSSFSPEVGNLSDSTNKFNSWILNPFAAAAAAGFNGIDKNNGLENNNRKKSNNNNDSSMNQHTFATPKAPINNSKSKTVAAVLAACRNSPTNIRSNSGSNFDKPKRPSQRRKANGRPMKSSTITSPPNNEDDFFDPTSMLEVVTVKPSGHHENNNYNFMSSESEGMDLTTTASSVIQKSPSITTTTAVRSKAMNKDYGFLNELGLVRKDHFSSSSEPINGHDNPTILSSTASLEHFVQNMLPHRQNSSPPATGDNDLSNPPSNNDANTPTNESSDRSKNLVLEAFNFDPELAGDARGVARKYGLNIRVVQKWIREAPTRSIPSSSSLPSNGSVNLTMLKVKSEVLSHMENSTGEEENNPISSSHQKSRILHFANTNGPTVNKRKNPKPNQICDFADDDLEESNGPLDMVVPIKKRRVSSTPTPTSA